MPGFPSRLVCCLGALLILTSSTPRLLSDEPAADPAAADPIAAEQPVASEPTAATEPASDGGPQDVTDRVKVRVTAPLRSDRAGDFSAGIAVENTSDEVLAGRLVVVIDSTGIDGLKAALLSGELETGEEFVEVLPLRGKLKPGESTRSVRISFTAASALDAEARTAFELQARVFQLSFPKFPVLEFPEPTDADREPLPGKSYSQVRLNDVMQIQNRWTERLMQHEAVYGTATAEDDDGNLAVMVFTQRHGVIKELPGFVEGIPVIQKVNGTSFRAGPAWDRVIEINGRKKALGPPPGPESQSAGGNQALAADGPYPTDPTIRFERPVPIGVSIINRPDACASGTLGCRVVFRDGSLGILSNSHVMARESAPAAQKEDLLNRIIGDDIIQPGCADGGSDVVGSNDIIGTLYDFQTFTLTGINTIDAAVARIRYPQLDFVTAETPGDGYGFPSRTPKAAVPGMKVKKYGRTTTYREGSIRGVNANVLVRFTRGDLFFTGQLTIYGNHETFGAPGDSGSLIVTQVGNHPVGLLYAGGGFATLANPIDLVLDRFNIAIDDGSMRPPTDVPAGTTLPGGRGSGRTGRAGGRFIPPPAGVNIP